MVSKEQVKKLKIWTEWETVKKIVDTQASMTRFGDGEFRMAAGCSVRFQLHHPKLTSQLKEILQLPTDPTPRRPLIVAIPRLQPPNKTFWWPIMKDFYYLFNPKTQYGSSFISRGDNAPQIMEEKYWQLWRQIWQNRSVVSIEGGKAISKNEKDLFANTKSFQIIKGPSENAYAQYDQIYKQALSHPKNTLFLIGLGAPGSILAWQLHQQGYQALDIGHLGMFYDRKIRPRNRQVKSTIQLKLLIITNLEKDWKFDCLLNALAKSPFYKKRIGWERFSNPPVSLVKLSDPNVDFVLCHQVTEQILGYQKPIIICERTDSVTFLKKTEKYLFHPLVVAVYKDYIFTDLNYYRSSYLANRYHFQLLTKGHKSLLASPTPNSKIQTTEQLAILKQKLHCLTWNLEQYSHVGARISQLAKKPTRPPNKRKWDVFFICNSHQERSVEYDPLKKHRQQGVKLLKKLAQKHGWRIATKNCDVRRYLEKLQKSKICIAPYGLGSRIALDEYGLVANTVVIKPQMDFVQSDPDLYRLTDSKTSQTNGQFYQFCRPDWSDLETIIQHILAHYPRYFKKTKEQRKVLLTQYDQNYFLQKFYDTTLVIKKNFVNRL